MKISGLDKLSKQLEEAQKAFAAIDGELGTVSFNPNDPASIEAAIQKIEMLLDEKVGPYRGNPIVAPMIEEMKERYRAKIIEQAAAARMSGDDE